MKNILLLFTLLYIVSSHCFSFAGNSVLNDAAERGTFVIPPNYSGVPGTAGFLGPLANSQRTYQLLIRDSLLTSIVGYNITAISWRLLQSASSNWPASAVSFTNYDIYLSGSVAPENRSLVFAQNVVGVQKLVRSGSLNIPAGSYPSGLVPNNFGPEITFDSNWVYTGGHLLIEIRHTGFTGTSSSVDAVGTSVSGYGFLFSACWTGNYSGTSGSQGNFAIVRISADPPVSVSNETQIISDYSLSQNYPNPFNPETTIKFSMLSSAEVSLIVYDLAGSRVHSIITRKQLAAGQKSYNFNAESLSSGVYFYSLIVNNQVIDTKKMILIK